MSKFIGRLADIGIAKEASRGSAESAASFWLPKISFTYDDEIEQVVDESSRGVIEDSPDAKVVGKRGVGEIEGNVQDKSFGLLLLSAPNLSAEKVAEVVRLTLDEDPPADATH